jgi:hypothetical protein
MKSDILYLKQVAFAVRFQPVGNGRGNRDWAAFLAKA